jgi:TIR domain
MEPPYQKAKYDVFLSYSAKDRVFVSRLAADLQGAGFAVWLDQWGLQGGDTIVRVIEQALGASRLLLVVMSPDYFQSQWTQQEWQYGMSREIDTGSVKLVPILYRDCEIPPMLRGKRWVDFRDPTDYQATLSGLVSDLQRLLARDAPGAGTVGGEPGERAEELDIGTLLALKKTLQDAVDAFRAGATTTSRPEPKVSVLPIDEKMCFIVMPFGIESLNIVYEDFIRPTLSERCMLRPERGDDVFGSNVIMDDITKSIQKARLVVADLTGRNPNVFYEVGIAHALNKQVLLLTQSIDDVPFDLRHRRALVYEYSPRGCRKLERDLFENVTNMLAKTEEA